MEVIEATVTAVDQRSRAVTLRGPAGNEIEVMAGPEVRNLAQVRVGDKLRVSYYTAVIAALNQAGGGTGDVTLAAARADEGERPTAVAGATVTGTVEVVSIAAEGKRVSFRDSEGQLRSIDVPRAESQAFARKLKPGDLVDISYVEAVAVELDAGD